MAMMNTIKIIASRNNYDVTRFYGIGLDISTRRIFTTPGISLHHASSLCEPHSVMSLAFGVMQRFALCGLHRLKSPSTFVP